LFVFVLLVGLVMLIGGAELLVQGAGRIAVAFRVPVIVVALTIVAFGTSMPEIMVSIKAAVSASPEMALANVNGSNIANIALVLGAAAMVRPLSVGRELMTREIPTVIGLQLAVPLLLYDGVLSRLDGLLLVLAGVLYNTLLIRDAMSGRRMLTEDDEVGEGGDSVTNGALMMLGLALLLGGAEFFVSGAVDLAEYMGMDQRTIGLTVVALGTSAPEVITAVVSAYRGEVQMAVGNSLGSNILNISMALGMTALIEPVRIIDQAAWNDLAVVVVVTFMLVPVVLRGRALSRIEGGLFAGAYIMYVLMVPSI
jgi:cation:H+ antiporter